MRFRETRLLFLCGERMFLKDGSTRCIGILFEETTCIIHDFKL